MQKTILITGATDGIGLETAKRLAEMGHNLLLHGRSAEKLAAAESIAKAASAEGRIVSYIADLSNIDEVKALGDNVSRNHSTLDVVINNAGIFKVADGVTPRGFDIRFVVNTFAPYLLTKSLLPILAEDGRIVNVSSAAQAPVDLEALSGNRPVDDQFNAYAQSKLALTMWSNHLANAFQGGRQVIVAVNPGSLLASKMVKEGFGVAGNDIGIGADILIRAALSEEFANASGQYFDNDAGRFNSPHPDAQSLQKCKTVVDVMDAALTSLD